MIQDFKKKDFEKEIFGNETIFKYIIGKYIDNYNVAFEKICGFERNDTHSNIFIEGQTTSPYKSNNENTKLDIACGAILKKDSTMCQLEYAKEGNAVNFSLVKYLSDVNSNKTSNPCMNDFDMMLENLLCFQGENIFPDKIVLTLITPKCFKENPENRFYGYKMKDYGYNEKKMVPKKLLDTIEFHQKSEIKRIEKEWKYPDNIQERIKKIELRWITMEELFGQQHRAILDLDLTKVSDAKKAWEILKTTL